MLLCVLQELLAQEAADRQRGTQDLDLEDLRGDPDLEKLHRDRMAELQREVEKRQVLQRRGHGELQVGTVCLKVHFFLVGEQQGSVSTVTSSSDAIQWDGMRNCT